MLLLSCPSSAFHFPQANCVRAIRKKKVEKALRVSTLKSPLQFDSTLGYLQSIQQWHNIQLATLNGRRQKKRKANKRIWKETENGSGCLASRSLVNYHRCFVGVAVLLIPSLSRKVIVNNKKQLMISWIVKSSVTARASSRLTASRSSVIRWRHKRTAISIDFS